ncbi:MULTISPECIES: Ig-like domain-containing protein [Burkholderia]|uniref:Ig-like domain-containing protein n=1 Tax=Burkholderia TaxID=32008 RepID=UPI001FC870A5|nr:Ig-like domain-containing protein [Burkholderia ambifaria]
MKRLSWLSAVFLIVLAAGCGGSSHSQPASAPGGTQDTTRPIVSAAVPAPGATGVGVTTKIVVTFSKDMAPATISASSFTVSGPGATPIAGTVTYNVASRAAVFTSTNTSLPVGSVLTATITTAAKDASGNALQSNFVWTFTTAAAPDVTPPTVTLSVPAAGATNVALNTHIAATFSEDMDPSTITATSFTLTGPGSAPVAGTVSYAAGAKSAIFTPTTPAVLSAATTYNATVTTAAHDLSGNAIASEFVWTFTTGTTTDTTPPSIVSANPANAATGVCTNKSANVTFSEAMDPSTITGATFTVAASNTPTILLSGTVAYDVPSKVATFTATNALVANTSYNVTVTTGVKDLAGNALASASVTTFTTNSSLCTTAPALGAAQSFGSFGGNATVTNAGLNTVIHGDLGVNAASTKITGLTDSSGTQFTTTPSNNGLVTGLVYTLTAPANSVPGLAVTQASHDATIAFNSLSPASLPGGIDVSSLAQCPSCGGTGGGADELAGRTLPPGIYLSSTGTFDIGGVGRTTANLTLDAGGDANAVWVFQTAAGTGTLNVGLTGPATPAVPIQVLLVNGAQAKNVFWYVPAGAVIGTGSTMTGTMLANAAITLSTVGGTPPTAVITTLNGRAIALTAAVTMVNTVINLPSQ